MMTTPFLFGKELQFRKACPSLYCQLTVLKEVIMFYVLTSSNRFGECV